MKNEKVMKLEDAQKYLPPVVWNQKVANTELEKFQKIIEATYKTKFDSYWDLHKWSIENFPNFWEEVWKFLGIISSSPHREVFRKTGYDFLDCEWFSGARFNFAENILRFKSDDIALICADETDYEETVSYSEMYDSVRLYAAAFKRNGLRRGDRVACYMSNRKEAIFSFLATVSIGAIFGGPNPQYGARQATNIIQTMEPKFLISIDHHLDNNIEFHNIEQLEQIVNNTPSLEKIIIVTNKPHTLYRDTSNIRNCFLLDEFLKTGRNADGSVPNLEFEQLPFDYPIVVNFTSGTTGLPKGPVHSAGSLLATLSNLVFYWDLKKGDVIYSYNAVGWNLWDTFIVSLAWGAKIFLYAGDPSYNRKGYNIWDTLTQYNVKALFLSTVRIDTLESMDVVPGPKAHLRSLKFIGIGGSPVKANNYLFILNKVKKDVVTYSHYGATETFGTFSGVNINMPVYAKEIQVPGLGMDIKCYDEDGNSVLNQRGEMVQATPSPSLPIYLWNDVDNRIMKETYLSKYPGVWCQHDEIWINPETRGMVVIGRSDDTIIQYGDRFAAGDIYAAIDDVQEIQDAVCVGQENDSGDCRAILFVQMKIGHVFTQEFRIRLAEKILEELWFDFVPQLILETKEIPYNFNSKKVESIVRKIVATNKIPQMNNIKNPECLQHYVDIPEIVTYNRPSSHL